MKVNRKKLIRFFAAVLIVSVAAFVTVGAITYQRLKQIAANPKEALAEIFEQNNQLNDETVTYNGEEYVYNDNIVTLMLIGIDKRESDLSLGARSDMMVVVAIDTQKNTTSMIICPRDTKAMVRTVDSDGKVTDDGYHKLNASFPYGNGNRDVDAGCENVMYCVSRLLSCDGKYDVPLMKYGGINMDGIGPLTSAVGGVTVTINETTEGVGKKGETVTLNSSTAEIFCVTRHDLASADIGRGQRQMVYMMGLAKKIKSMEVTSIVSIYNKVSKYAFTNLSSDGMVAYASYLKSISLDDITMTQLKGAWDGSYYVLDDDFLEQTIIDTFYVKKS